MRPAPAICGMVPCSPWASDLDSASAGASGPHSPASVLGVGGGHVDLRAQVGAGAAQGGHLERRDRHVRHGRAGRKAGRQRDHRHAVGARSAGQLAAGGGHHPRRAQRARGLVAGQGLLGVAAVGAAEHGGVGRRPGRQLVGAGQDDRPRGPIAQRRRGPAIRRSPSPPSRPRSARRGRRRAGSAADSTRHSASRSWLGRSRTSSSWPERVQRGHRARGRARARARSEPDRPVGQRHSGEQARAMRRGRCRPRPSRPRPGRRPPRCGCRRRCARRRRRCSGAGGSPRRCRPPAAPPPARSWSRRRP